MSNNRDEGHVCKYRSYLPEQDVETWDVVDHALDKIDIEAKRRVLKLLAIKLNEQDLMDHPGTADRPPVFVNVP